MPNEKKKSIGKIIVVVLATAVFFFLLLPFLEEDTPATANQKAKKAVPQIFTSNPLSELVRKVYAMFSRTVGKRPRPAAQPGQPLEGEMLAQTTAQEGTRFAAQQESEGQTVSVGVSYTGYGEAGYINEDGEWVLIRQTAPDTAERGMHEVSASDNAYDKHVGLERAAKYAGQTKQAQVPDSKWARIWKPIKKFFGGSDEKDKVAPTTDLEKEYQLASSSSGLNGQKDFASHAAYFNQGPKPSLGGNMDFALNNPGRDAFFDILHPEVALEETAETFKDRAREMLGENSPQYKKFEAIVDRKKFEYDNKVKQKMNEAYMTRLQQAVDAQTGRAPAPSDICVGDVLYGCRKTREDISSNNPSEPLGLTEVTQKPQGSNGAQETSQVSFADVYRNVTGVELPEFIKDSPMNIMVILSKTDGVKAADLFPGGEAQNDAEKELQKQVYEYFRNNGDFESEFFEQQQLTPEQQELIKRKANEFLSIQLTEKFYKERGCEEQTCYAIMLNLSETAREVVSGTGLNLNVNQKDASKDYVQDPLNVYGLDYVNNVINTSEIHLPAQEEGASDIVIPMKELTASFTEGLKVKVGFYNEQEDMRAVSANLKPITDENGKKMKSPDAAYPYAVSPEVAQSLVANGTFRPVEIFTKDSGGTINPNSEKGPYDDLDPERPTQIISSDNGLTTGPFNKYNFGDNKGRSVELGKDFASHIQQGQEIVGNGHQDYTRDITQDYVSIALGSVVGAPVSASAALEALRGMTSTQATSTSSQGQTNRNKNKNKKSSSSKKKDNKKSKK